MSQSQFNLKVPALFFHELLSNQPPSWYYLKSGKFLLVLSVFVEVFAFQICSMEEYFIVI